MSTTLFENLLPEVTAVLEVINGTEVAATPQSKRKLVQAVSILTLSTLRGLLNSPLLYIVEHSEG